MEPVDAAYLAGLLDGEGCLAVRGTKWSRPSVEVCMTTPAPLGWARTVTGAGNIYRRPQARVNRRLSWVWVVTRTADTAAVVAAVQPFLKVKWPEAQVLRIFATLRRGQRPYGPRLNVGADDRLVKLSSALKRDDRAAAYQEALDLAVYLRQAIEERR